MQTKDETSDKMVADPYGAAPRTSVLARFQSEGAGLTDDVGTL